MHPVWLVASTRTLFDTGRYAFRAWARCARTKPCLSTKVKPANTCKYSELDLTRDAQLSMKSNLLISFYAFVALVLIQTGIGAINKVKSSTLCICTCCDLIASRLQGAERKMRERRRRRSLLHPMCE
mgnify:CR=1 FL=1